MSEAKRLADAAEAEANLARLSACAACLAAHCEPSGERRDYMTHMDLRRLLESQNLTLPKAADDFLWQAVTRAFASLPNGMANPNPPVRTKTHGVIQYKYLRLIPTPSSAAPYEEELEIPSSTLGEWMEEGAALGFSLLNPFPSLSYTTTIPPSSSSSSQE